MIIYYTTSLPLKSYFHKQLDCIKKLHWPLRIQLLSTYWGGLALLKSIWVVIMKERHFPWPDLPEPSLVLLIVLSNRGIGIVCVQISNITKTLNVCLMYGFVQRQSFVTDEQKSNLKTINKTQLCGMFWCLLHLSWLVQFIYFVYLFIW